MRKIRKIRILFNKILLIKDLGGVVVKTIMLLLVLVGAHAMVTVLHAVVGYMISTVT